MKQNHFQFIFLMLLLLAISVHAANNTFVLSGGVIHPFFKVVTSELSDSEPGASPAYSMSFQYNRQINQTIGVGLRLMFRGLNLFQEEGIIAATLPVLVTMNYRLFSLGVVDNHVQFAAGLIFPLKSDKGFDNQKFNNLSKPGYGAGIFSCYKVHVVHSLGMYAEGGLLYEKYNFGSFHQNNGKITALLQLGISFNY